MWKSLTALAAGAVVLAGCASNAPAPTTEAAAPITTTAAHPASDKAGLYVYRDGIATTIDNNITLNGQCLGQSKKGGYFFIELPAGKHKLETIALFKQNVIDLDMQAGKSYYVRHYLQFHVVAPYPNLEVMSEAKARPAIAKLKPLDNGRCK